MTAIVTRTREVLGAARHECLERPSHESKNKGRALCALGVGIHLGEFLIFPPLILAKNVAAVKSNEHPFRDIVLEPSLASLALVILTTRCAAGILKPSCYLRPGWRGDVIAEAWQKGLSPEEIDDLTDLLKQ